MIQPSTMTEAGGREVVNCTLAFKGFHSEVAHVTAIQISLPKVNPVVTPYSGKPIILSHSRKRRIRVLLNTNDHPSNIEDDLTLKYNEILSYFDLY